MQKLHLLINFWIHCFFDQNGNGNGNIHNITLVRHHKHARNKTDKLADVNGNIHNITLVRHHKHARKSKLIQGIKDCLADIRQRTLTNIEENIVSQCSEQSFYYAKEPNKSIKCLQVALSKTYNKISFVCSVFTYDAGNTSKHFTSRAWLLTVGDGSYKT